LLIALDDAVLRYSFLTLCVESYVGKSDPTDPFMSPVFATDEDLKKFPPTRLQIAGRDPLRDEALRLIDRMLTLKKDVKYIEYRNSSHGFWTFGGGGVLKKAKDTIKKGAEILNYLLY
jgi:acetyl esterase/lipase